jgi:hypothetical protein
LHVAAEAFGRYDRQLEEQDGTHSDHAQQASVERLFPYDISVVADADSTDDIRAVREMRIEDYKGPALYSSHNKIMSDVLGQAAQDMRGGAVYGFAQGHVFEEVKHHSERHSFETNDDSFLKYPGYLVLLLGGVPLMATFGGAAARRSRVRKLLKAAEKGDGMSADDVGFLKQYYKVTAQPIDPEAHKPALPVRRSRSPK